MSVETQKPSMTTETAREIAAYLSALMNHPNTPDAIKHDLGNRITEMNSSINQDTPNMIAAALLEDNGKSADVLFKPEEKPEEKPKPKLSYWDVNFFTDKLSSLLGNRNLPDSLQEGIINGLMMLEGEVKITADKPEAIKYALLAYATDGFKVELEPDEKDKKFNRVSDLYSVLDNPELPRELKAGLKDFVVKQGGIIIEEDYEDDEDDESEGETDEDEEAEQSDQDNVIPLDDNDLDYLAHHLSAVLKYHGTPTKIYDAIAEEINDLTQYMNTDDDSAGEIKKRLRAYSEHKGEAATA